MFYGFKLDRAAWDAVPATAWVPRMPGSLVRFHTIGELRDWVDGGDDRCRIYFRDFPQGWGPADAVEYFEWKAGILEYGN